MAKSKHISEPIKITKILDTDDEGNSPGSDADSSKEDIGELLFLPPLKKAKHSSGSTVILDAEGVPMFDPGDIQHPNSTEWLPAEHVADYVTARLRTPLDKQARAKLRSECPLPALSSKITATPAIDSSLLTFFTRYRKDHRKGVDKAWSTCQDKLLDIVGPLTRIFDMAESARLDQVAIDAEELSLWAQRAGLFGSASGAELMIPDPDSRTGRTLRIKYELWSNPAPSLKLKDHLL
ncbi:hypothetical protein NDU88_005447 [Pleurodeles waltl]|uniref:Uncharacterized protein n=1 Tax=Pleurodeles waltl TaxID=8319 RepID=A0AAV7PFE1_PLEWA|nr:hypothetical protein NDU88_005447 [Pleurodeles waltl]